MITEKTTLQELFDHVMKSLDMVREEETFMVKDLFTGLEWNRIPKGLRTKLGGMFLSFSREQNPRIFMENGKTPQNQQIYIKTSRNVGEENGRNTYNTQYITYAYKEDDDEFWWYSCRFYLHNSSSLCVLMSDHDGDRFIYGINKFVSPEIFAKMFLERFSSFDYYNIRENNSIPFEKQYESIIDYQDGNYVFVGGYSDSFFSLNIWKLHNLIDYFKPLISLLDDDKLFWKRDGCDE